MEDKDGVLTPQDPPADEMSALDKFADRISDARLRALIGVVALAAAVVAATIGGFAISGAVGCFTAAGGLLLVALVFGWDNSQPVTEEATDGVREAP